MLIKEVGAQSSWETGADVTIFSVTKTVDGHVLDGVYIDITAAEADELISKIIKARATTEKLKVLYARDTSLAELQCTLNRYNLTLVFQDDLWCVYKNERLLQAYSSLSMLLVGIGDMSI